VGAADVSAETREHEQMLLVRSRHPAVVEGLLQDRRLHALLQGHLA
jgi:hypothetical protein